MSSKWPSGYVQANGIRIHYTRTGGNRPPLVLLHGLTDNGRCWGPVAEVLQADYDIIMPDMRAHGFSDAPESGYSLMMLAKDVAGMIDALGLERPLVIGHSLGAITALLLACMSPDKVRAVVLEDPPEWWYAKPEPTGVPKWIREFKQKTREQLLAQQRAATPSWSEAELEPWLDSRAELNLKAVEIVNPDGLVVDWDALLPNVQCPVLAIPADPTMGPALSPAGVESLRGYVPQLEVVTLSGAAHSVHRERFGPYMEAVRAFLARQD